MEKERIIEILEGEYKTMSVWLGSSKECREHNEAISIAIEAVKNMQRLIPVSERLPKQQETVLIQDFDNITIGYLNGENRWRDLTNLDDYLKGVVAWMPLPELYQE